MFQKLCQSIYTLIISILVNFKVSDNEHLVRFQRTVSDKWSSYSSLSASVGGIVLIRRAGM